MHAGSTGFVTEVSIGRQAVRIAWADPDTQKPSNDDGVGGGREDDGVESVVADEAGREGGRRGEEAEEEEGGRERGRGQKDGRLEETSFDRGETLNSVSSSHSSLLHSLPSSVGNLTDYSEMSLPTTSAASIAAAGRNGLSEMGVPATYTVTSTTNAAVEGLEGVAVTAGGMNPPLSEVSREKFDSTSHLHTAVEVNDQSQSSLPLPVVRPTALHAVSSMSISAGEETSELSLPAAGAPDVVKGVGSDANLQVYSASDVTRRSQSPLVQTTSAPGLTGVLPVGESREGFPLEIKYSLPVDPVSFHTQEREGWGSFQPSSLYTDALESDSLYLPVPGNGNEASPAREWDLSALASSLSQVK